MTTTRILKEARPLFWPWCAVSVAGALPLIYPVDWTSLIFVVGFFLVPLLATLSLGFEFQNGTLSLLLSQPAGRLKVWGEKLTVTGVAILSAVLVFSLALRATSIHINSQDWAFAGAWIIATFASATFWTLTARSTVGGVVLTLSGQCLILMAANLPYWRQGAELYPDGTNMAPIAPLVLIGYAGAMLGLGGRKLARSEATGGLAGDDLLASGPALTPGALTAWLRCRPTGAVLNLFRKELRLLRPVWLISLGAALAWACLALFGWRHEAWSNGNLAFVMVRGGEIGMLGIAILAGCLSLDEEKAAGTHAWNLTLPAPALLQWRVKLYVAIFSSVVGAGLIPILIMGKLSGSPRVFADEHLGLGWLVAVAVLTYVSFWCACTVGGTVRVLLWVIPVTMALGLASGLGGWAAHKLVYFLVGRFDLFADFKFASHIASSFRSSPLLDLVYFMSGGLDPYSLLATARLNPWIGGELTLGLAALWLPTLLWAAIQCYRCFRTQVRSGPRTLTRNLPPLTLIAFLCSFVLMAVSTFYLGALNQTWTAQYETLRAVGKIRFGAASVDAAHPLQLTVRDLARVSPLSEYTRRWLRSPAVTIVPLQGAPPDFWGIRKSTGDAGAPVRDYLATIHLGGGADCRQSFRPWWQGRDSNMLVVICK